MPGRFSTKYGTPVGDSVRQDPADALATLLGVDNQDGFGAGVSSDFVDPSGNGSLELSNMRGARETELKERVNNGDRRAAQILPGLEQEISADPFTGDAQAKLADQNREQYTTAVELNEPSNPLAQQQKHLEKFLLMKAGAEHPQSGALFPSGGINGGGGVPQMGAGLPNQGTSEFEQRTANLSPEEKQFVKGLLDYTQIIPTGSTALKSYAPYMALAQQIDPTFAPSDYDNRQKLKVSFTSGPESDRLRSLNALISHISTLERHRGELNNFNIGGKVGNYPVNALEKFFNVGSAAHGTATEFDTTHGHVGTELAKFLAGSGVATDEQRRSLDASRITSNSGDEDIQGYLRSVVDLAGGQFGGMLDKAKVIPALRDRVLGQLSPEAKVILKAIIDRQGAVQ